MKKLTLLAALSLLTATQAFAAPVKTVDTAKGQVIADEKGMTLYTFRKDTKGVSNCYDQCAANWPPFLAEAGAEAEGGYSLVERKDGSMQWAKDGMPLYFWVKDEKSGDVTGDGVGGVWDAAHP
ncbi:MAG: hypothetical protein QHC90_05265 [Shinella sp.]|nr:hypothetical protein [Shinella sp.]